MKHAQKNNPLKVDHNVLMQGLNFGKCTNQLEVWLYKVRLDNSLPAH